jgi:hypothetical protein
VRTRVAAAILLLVTEQVKAITLIANNVDVVDARRHVAGCAICRDLRVVSFDERRGRLSTKLDVTVAGDPQRIREFHDDVRGDAWTQSAAGNPVDSIITDIAVSGFRAARRKWQGRHDRSPEEEGSGEASTPSRARTVVYWRWEEGAKGGEPVGRVWVDTYAAGETYPETSEQWPEGTRRADALAYAREHGYVFFPDE